MHNPPTASGRRRDFVEPKAEASCEGGFSETFKLSDSSQNTTILYINVLDRVGLTKIDFCAIIRAIPA